MTRVELVTYSFIYTSFFLNLFKRIRLYLEHIPKTELSSPCQSFARLGRDGLDLALGF